MRDIPVARWTTKANSVSQRESDHRENLATTIRTLRASESEQTTEMVCAQSVDGYSGF
jgi:hypothetical protein